VAPGNAPTPLPMNIVRAWAKPFADYREACKQEGVEHVDFGTFVELKK